MEQVRIRFLCKTIGLAVGNVFLQALEIVFLIDLLGQVVLWLFSKSF